MTCRNQWPLFSCVLGLAACTETQPAGYQTSIELWPGSHQTNQQVTVRGQGTDRVGSVDIEGGAGTIDLDGSPAAVIVHARQPWQGRTLYQAVAVQEGRLWLLWFYCSGGYLTHVYSEDTQDAPLAYEDASGGCRAARDYPSSHNLRNATALVLVTPVPRPVSTPAYQIFAGGLGLMGDKTIYVHEVVECPAGRCGSDWLEYHAVVVGERETCTGIFYVFPGGHSTFAYPFCWGSA